ncbi:hypothetical protein LWI28_029208 [Acer negundo]|uniref:Cytochrome b5 heme-binding domain-containing protein n=1 Tax=Acer negundo TaxID=4023 RepID=A0AAD5NVC3_ACENE|nr:hypothetical protein LWI28_029208 [Acer negundo]
MRRVLDFVGDRRIGKGRVRSEVKGYQLIITLQEPLALRAKMAKVLDFEDVKKHNHKTDCWLIISGKVYDVTPFLDDHPGGDEALINVTGKDATDDFDDVGHSKSAIDMLQKYYVGEIDKSTIPTTKKYKPPPRETLKPSDSEFVVKILQFLGYRDSWWGLRGLTLVSMAKVHDFQEVKKHNDRTDCWLIISGKVYDVTLFLEDHPGGDEVMLAATEKDATEDFEEVGHSKSAKEMMEKYYIGEVDKSTVPPIKKYKPPPRIDLKTDNDTGFGTKILQFLIPLLILGIGFALRYLKKEE